MKPVMDKGIHFFRWSLRGALIPNHQGKGFLCNYLVVLGRCQLSKNFNKKCVLDVILDQWWAKWA